MFFKIYKDLVEIDPNFGLQSNDIHKKIIIHNVAEELNKVLGEEEMENQIMHIIDSSKF